MNLFQCGIDVCSVVCVVEDCFFHASGCFFLRLYIVVGVCGILIFVLSVIRVVGGIKLCVFRRVYIVCWCLLCT